jgi:hypothetical protein
MANKKTAVFGIYKSVNHAERAVDYIAASGFSYDDISVLLPDSESSEQFAHEKHTKAPEGTATGVTAGGAVGGTLGLLVGVGALAIPGLGPFIARRFGRGRSRGRADWCLGRNGDSRI